MLAIIARPLQKFDCYQVEANHCTWFPLKGSGVCSFNGTRIIYKCTESLHCHFVWAVFCVIQCQEVRGSPFVFKLTDSILSLLSCYIQPKQLNVKRSIFLPLKEKKTLLRERVLKIYGLKKRLFTVLQGCPVRSRLNQTRSAAFLSVHKKFRAVEKETRC